MLAAKLKRQSDMLVFFFKKNNFTSAGQISLNLSINERLELLFLFHGPLRPILTSYCDRLLADRGIYGHQGYRRGGSDPGGLAAEPSPLESASDLRRGLGQAAAYS